MPTAPSTSRLATLVLTAAYLAVSLPAEARITKLVLSTVQSPTFGGTFFGTIGPYEKLAGRAFGEIDPSDPLNATITDLASAPRNAAGKVEYSMDVYLLKPVDMAQASGKLFYESNNRGLKLATGVINTVDRLFLSNDPTTPADAGDGFLMRQGYVIAWSGWDVTVASGRVRCRSPCPSPPTGRTSIVGPSLEEFVVDATTATNRISMPPRRPTPRPRPSAFASTTPIRRSRSLRRLGVRRQPYRPPAARGHALPAGTPLRPRLSGAGSAGHGARVRGDA